MRTGAEPPGARRHLTSMEKVPFLDFKEVLVTGGTGFLGRHVCRALISRGYLPRLLVRVGSGGRAPGAIARGGGRGAARVFGAGCQFLPRPGGAGPPAPFSPLPGHGQFSPAAGKGEK